MSYDSKALEPQPNVHPAPSSPGASDNLIIDLTNLIRQQNEVMQDMADVSTRGMRDLLAVLRKMDDRQAAATAQSMQPIRTVSATSSSAWSPLLRSHLENIQPTVDRWRGTLDTLLVFVALFSAVITAFFIESLKGLSEDTGKRTNELLTNLTDIIIILNRANASILNPTHASPFKPEPSSIRLNFYWSISLILSVSIASLAVTTRGYVSMITRSRRPQAHKKLTELHLRWEKTKKLLGPAVEALPQMLIPPVGLFVVGLLDTLISISLPRSSPFYPILAAAIISCIFATAVGAYTLSTVIHGCVDHSRSPFQSTLSSWISAVSLTGKARIADGELKENNWTAERHAAFHSTIHNTHDDDVIDQAVAAVESVIEERRIVTNSPHGPLEAIDVSESEMETFKYLLSSEVSYRANLAIATAISRSLITVPAGSHSPTSTKAPVKRYSYGPKDRMTLLDLLRTAPGTRPIASWSSSFTTAMAQLLCSGISSRWYTEYSTSPFEFLSQAAPVLSLLLMPFEDVSLETHKNRLWWSVESPVLYYAYDALLAKLMGSHPGLGSPGVTDPSTELHAVVEELMTCQSKGVLDTVHVILQTWLRASTETHTPLLLSIHYRGQPSIKVPLPESFAHWIITPGMSKLTSGEVMHGVYQAVNFSRVHHLASGLEERNWIIFLCDELFTSIFRDSPQDRTPLYPTLLAICVELVLIAVDTYGSYTHPVGERARFCTVTCQLKPLIIRLLGGIRQNASNTHLDPSTWNSISSALQRGISSQDDPSWSTIQHRNEVKQEILEAFRQLAPPG
ncbi:hypothetical protein FPV67DRAFT_1227716 [Lyophyllum atratum]|nr:hypothetical protein FPV67DRAFT_1227716 [Lyophyllum atratum]